MRLTLYEGRQRHKLEQGQLLIGIIQTVAFLTPVGLLVWRMAKLDSKVNQHERDIDGIGKKVSTISHQSIEVDQQVINQLADMGKRIEGMMASLNHLKDDVRDLKADMREFNKVHHGS